MGAQRDALLVDAERSFVVDTIRGAMDQLAGTAWA
jgi:hypothetical protein